MHVNEIRKESRSEFRRDDPLATLKKGMLMSTVRSTSGDILGTVDMPKGRGNGAEGRNANMFNMSPLSSI